MKKYFITGLIILLPAVIAIGILLFLIGFLTGPFLEATTDLLTRLHIPALSSPKLLSFLSRLLILIALFLFTLLLGLIARTLCFKALLNLGGLILKKIPFFNTVYQATREIIQTLFRPDSTALKQVVLVPFPHKDVYAVGLISREAPAACSNALGQELISVFLPTTPSPTNGFLLLFPKEEIIPVSISAEEAIKYILSCGLILPQSKEVSS